MVQVFADRVMQPSTTTGTGSITLAGTVAGYQQFSDALTNGNEIDYVIFAVDGSGVPTGQWETGRGVWSAGVLTRTTPVDGSAATPVNFGAGTKYVALTALAQFFDAAGGAWYFAPPAAASFPNTFGTSFTLTDDADVGLIVQRTTVSTSAIAGASKAITTPSADWQVTLRMNFAVRVTGTANFGFTMHNTAETMFLAWCWDTRGWVHLARFNATGFDGFETNLPHTPVNWMRVSYTASSGTATFSVSDNGKTWHQLLTRTVKASDFSGSDPTHVGLFAIPEGYDTPLGFTVDHWTDNV